MKDGMSVKRKRMEVTHKEGIDEWLEKMDWVLTIKEGNRMESNCK